VKLKNLIPHAALTRSIKGFRELGRQSGWAFLEVEDIMKGEVSLACIFVRPDAPLLEPSDCRAEVYGVTALT
jgi:hypothetical protein